jgi:small subunit ribosomal protein S20
MATHKSALKRQKQDEKRSQRNVHIRSTLKTLIKRVRLALSIRPNPRG